MISSLICYTRISEINLSSEGQKKLSIIQVAARLQLRMLPTSDFAMTPRLKLAYTNFGYVSTGTSYKLFKAQPYDSEEFHMIRVFDTSIKFAQENFNLAATLFIQELLHLCSLQPESVFINTFEICEEGHKMAYATRSCVSLSSQLADETGKTSIDPKSPEFIQHFLRDVLRDIEFLWKSLHLRKIAETVEPDDVYFMKETNTYFLGNWAKILESSKSIDKGNMTTTTTVYTTSTNSVTPQEMSEEINGLGLAVLKINSIDYSDILSLREMPNLTSTVFDAAIEAKISETFRDSKFLKNLLPKMLSKDPQKLPSLEELRGHVDMRKEIKKSIKFIPGISS